MSHEATRLRTIEIISPTIVREMSTARRVSLGDAILELRVAHQRGTEHRVTAFVVVDAGLTGCIDQDFGGHAPGPLRGAPILQKISFKQPTRVKENAVALCFREGALAATLAIEAS
jgi:hypothetical protein